MNKYIPKVGEAFEWEASGNWDVSGIVVLVTPLEIVWLDDYGITQFLTISKSIMRPIPTKANVEREHLRNCLAMHTNRTESAINEIQKAGFTIPKKIKRSDVHRIITTDISKIYQHNLLIVNDICDLLGDLVEQDEKGGAE
jgi:hypothetical protein